MNEVRTSLSRSGRSDTGMRMGYDGRPSAVPSIPWRTIAESVAIVSVVPQVSNRCGR
jgi:hypothetical protein